MEFNKPPRPHVLVLYHASASDVDFEYISLLTSLSKLTNDFEFALLVLRGSENTSKFSHESTISPGFIRLSLDYRSSNIKFVNDFKLALLIKAGIKIFNDVFGQPEVVHFYNFTPNLLVTSFVKFRFQNAAIIIGRKYCNLFRYHYFGQEKVRMPLFIIDLKYLDRIDNNIKLSKITTLYLGRFQDQKVDVNNLELAVGFEIQNIIKVKDFHIFMLDKILDYIKGNHEVNTMENDLLYISLVASHLGVGGVNYESNIVFNHKQLTNSPNCAREFSEIKTEDFDLPKSIVDFKLLYTLNFV